MTRTLLACLLIASVLTSCASRPPAAAPLPPDGPVGGVGLVLDRDERGGRIDGVLGGSPAATAGLAMDEIVAAVDGQAVDGWAPERIAARLAGAVGSEVTADVLDAAGARRTVALRREVVDIGGVTGRLVGGIGVIRIRSFSRHTPYAVRDAVAWLTAAGATGLCLDLRNSLGGPVPTVGEVAELLVDPPATLWVARMHGRDTVVRASQPAMTALPLAVLIDAGTRDGSELLAGALRNAGRATLVGSPTPGALEILRPAPGDDGRMTIRKVGDYLFPALSRTGTDGIAPDVALDGDADDHAMLDAARAALGR
ncbi:MAG: PDZ domain-containing protein [Planctomycetes bacterium]|nr:PDZ domain-containing protein [Planctomycetota bacterium]